jgi:hypothetical protein
VDVDSDWASKSRNVANYGAYGVCISMGGVVCEDVYTTKLMIKASLIIFYAALSAQINVHCFCR